MRKKRRRFRLTAAQREEVWDRWQRGERMKAIGRALGRPSSSIWCQIKPHGGIRPRKRCRSRLALTLAEREEISRGIVAGSSIRSIARLLDRDPSTVSREIKRNGGPRRYREASAERVSVPDASLLVCGKTVVRGGFLLARSRIRRV